jgi:outer membrane protein OmpA-like peptidoglycan-associated protein
MSKYKLSIAALTLVSGFSISAARATDDAAGYLTTTQGAPVTASAAQCVHTGEWTQGMHFADCEPRPVTAEVAPAPVQALEVIEEIVVVREVAAVQTPAPFTLSLDTLFDFDSANLKADADAALDALAQEIVQADYRTVDVVGHADRIGAPLYNQRLSERRAQAVGAYLAAHGVDESKISFSGVGSSEPATGTQCKGLRGARLIACLQSDRFAEVSVAGTQHTAQQIDDIQQPLVR